MLDLQATRATASQIARAAGAALMRHFNQPHQEKTKQSPIDIVTEGDLAAERVIVPALRAAFPDHRIVSEEGGGGDLAADADYTWYIDPLDGTTNYANNLPLFAVSMGLAGRDLRPLVGVVYAPFFDELYSAARGLGVTRNGEPLRVSGTEALVESVVCTGFPYDRQTNPDNNLREWQALWLHTRSVRCFGSAATELSFVAAGRLEGFWEQRINPWDVMAGALFVQEAGGVITDYNGDDSDLLYTGRQVVASNGRIHTELLRMIRSARQTPQS
jgi:myo-inositol-1(or 4)-monophosphatase